MFVVEAFRSLRDDDHFLALLRAEGLDALPTYLGQSLDAGAWRNEPGQAQNPGRGLARL